MKIILAGLPKTGTKTINAALTELGFNVYDYLEHFMYHHDSWIKIFDGKATQSDYHLMYENVDVVVDVPACFHWKKIHQAFPDAKIILTLRDEKGWLKSLQTQMDMVNESVHTILGQFSGKFVPLIRKFIRFTEYNDHCLGAKREKSGLTVKVLVDHKIAAENFHKHNAEVLATVPNDKLLVYSVKEGWEPLCKFLDVEVPNKPFPHKNAGGKEVIEKMDDHEFGKQAFKQMLVVIGILLAAFILLFFLMSDYPAWVCISTYLSGFGLLFMIL